jgi:hypothetical protein
MIKLGYSLGVGPNPKYIRKERIKLLLSFEDEAVELDYVVADRLEEKLDAEDIQRLKKFKYISIHAPALTAEGGKWIKYPSNEAEKIINQIISIANEVNVKTIVFHPDLVDDFNWLYEKVGDRLAFENMDLSKSFGKTVQDLERIFREVPNAKWVCDVNHIYTIDVSMELTNNFHQMFHDRLCHYHLSGYGGFHDCLYISQEDIILEGIKDFSVPIIHEGRAIRDGLDSLSKENRYILDILIHQKSSN